MRWSAFLTLPGRRLVLGWLFEVRESLALGLARQPAPKSRLESGMSGKSAGERSQWSLRVAHLPGVLGLKMLVDVANVDLLPLEECDVERKEEHGWNA